MPRFKKKRLLKDKDRGFLRYTIRPVRPVEKELVCNRKGPLCKDLTVEINSIRLVFKGRMGSIRVLSKM
jgi:hypothetical protein